MIFRAGAIIVASIISLGQCQNSTSGSTALATASPTCIQPRQASDPAPISLSSALASVIPNACDSTQQQVVTSSTLSLVYYKFGAVYYNISRPINAIDNQELSPSSCLATFNSLINACINAPGPGFWGGWLVSSGSNYSISDLIYPANPLPSAEASSGAWISSASTSATQLSATLNGSTASLQTSLRGTVATPSNELPTTTPSFLTSSSQPASSGDGTAVTTNDNGGSLPSSMIGIGSPLPSSTGAITMPLPSLATIITGTVGSQVVTETFVPHIFPQYSTVSGTTTTTATLTSGGNPVTIVVGPFGVGWAPYHVPSGSPELPPPSILPPSAVAAADSANSTTAGASSASVPLENQVISSSILSGTGSQRTVGTASPVASVTFRTSISTSSLSSSQISLGTGFSGSSFSSSESNARVSSNAGVSTSVSLGTTPQPASISQIALPGSSSIVPIVPISYVTTAFNNPSQTITTLSVSGQAAIIYSKETLPGLSTITAPTTIQTSVVETETNGKTSTFVGGIVVGPGGVYWGPPGLPPVPRFPGISPPCVWPFCTGGGGGGGSDPPGDSNPPPPYTPDDPNTPDNNDQKTQDRPSDQSSQPPSTQNPSTSSSASQTSSVTSSASCSSQIVTDYWVSCASGASSSCSTYSSAVVSGCAVTAVTSTTGSACPLEASASPDPTMAGFDYSGGEYPVLSPGYSSDVQWTYIVADIVESGVVFGDASIGPSTSASTSQSVGTTISTGATSGAVPASGPSPTTMLTITNPPSSTSLITNTPSATTSESLCENFADPDNGVSGECQCSSGTFYTKLPLLTGQPNQCGYTTFPTQAPTPTTTSNPNPYPYTYTDLENGNIIACKSSSIGDAAVLYTVCEGDTRTIGTDPVIYGYYTSAETAAAVSASVASASAAAAAAAAIPTADCAFWDEALFWTFEVYNINGWAGNDGDSLHHQESGCGDLTGWSWKSGDPGNDQHAYFNLPFIIKSGCVERAIASAGGPSGLSCTANGLGKKQRSLTLGSGQGNAKMRRRFRTDVSAFSNRGLSDLQALQQWPNEALSTIESPSISERDITLAPKRLNARSEFEKLYELDSRDLVKRGCLDWLWPGNNEIPEEWWCNAVLPGVDACIQEIQKKNVVGKFPSLFYTSWGGIGDGSLGVEGTKLWAAQNICGRVVDFDGIVVSVYHYTVEKAVLQPFGKDGLNLPQEEQAQILDPFLKNLSQAFAEQSAGEAYVFVPKGVGFQPNSAWTGWEYPALTRNKRIDHVWKVELDYSDPSQFVVPDGRPQGVKTLLWTQGDGPSAIEPKGIRQGTLPAQIPEDQIPPNWQSSI